MHGADCVPRGKREEGTRSSSKVSPEAKPGRNRGVRIEAEALRELEFMGSEAQHECFSRRLGKRFEWHHDLVVSIAHLAHVLCSRRSLAPNYICSCHPTELLDPCQDVLCKRVAESPRRGSYGAELEHQYSYLI
jgi:hypothetical protein